MRPILPHDGKGEDADPAVRPALNDVTIAEARAVGTTGLGGSGEDCYTWNPFEFDHVHAPNTTPSAVFAEAAPLVESFVNGYNTCILAYGQVGDSDFHHVAFSFFLDA